MAWSPSDERAGRTETAETAVEDLTILRSRSRLLKAPQVFLDI